MDLAPHQDELGIFAKFWQPGMVKSRLARAIGEAAAAELQRQFVRCLVERLEELPVRHVLGFSPAARREAFAAVVSPSWLLVPQGDGDLGDRMQRYFEGAIARGAKRIVLLGTDSPTVPREALERAFELLETHAVVVGPSDDGGYYLIGVAGRIPPIFAGVAWSTDQVFLQTMQRLEEAGIPVGVLEPWYDVDELADLERLRDELNHASAAGREELRAAVHSALRNV